MGDSTDHRVPDGVALITGASSGIGAEFARRLAEAGNPLVLVARRTHRLDALAEELRARRSVPVEVLCADLAEAADVERVARRLGLGDVGLLVNNAGINGYGPFAETDPALLQRVIAVNVAAVTALARAAVPAMLARGAGAIVNVASVLAYSGGVPPTPPMPQRAVYAATKGYAVTFSRVLAAELADTPVRVQALCPGLTATEFHLTTGAWPVGDDAPAVHADGGMAPAEVVAASLAGLAAGEIVCVPGLSDDTALSRLADAEAAIRTAGRGPLAERYRR